jgi:hypothetical protein
MTIELPVLRLGLAGFSAEQRELVIASLPAVAPGTQAWMVGELDDADTWWVNGEAVQRVDESTVKVAAGHPSAHSLRLRLPEIDRPVAFTLPLACEGLRPAYSLDIRSPATMSAVLEKFEGWLSPLTAQLCLASHIVEHHAALRAGVFEVRLDGRQLAWVDMHGEVGVLPGACAADFEDADWRRCGSAKMPEDLARATMSQLMWQYSVRTQRDLLPRHYRTGLLYFRRPPRVPNRLLRDSHLLLMRELAAGPASFQSLQQATGMHPGRLAHGLAALYFVGSITANPKRAAPYQAPRRMEPGEVGSINSGLPSNLEGAFAGDEPPADQLLHDLTAPAPMGLP